MTRNAYPPPSCPTLLHGPNQLDDGAKKFIGLTTDQASNLKGMRAAVAENGEL